jgi:hypothetical protein
LGLNHQVLFFAVVNICLLNIVFGIMVDTFSQLREQQQDRNNTINNTCLICGKSRPEFTKGAHKMGFFQVRPLLSPPHAIIHTYKLLSHLVPLTPPPPPRPPPPPPPPPLIIHLKEHIKSEHNVFQYLSFVTYIRLKDDTEYNGIESYVSKCMRRGDISWLPNQMALSLYDVEVRSAHSAHSARCVRQFHALDDVLLC